MTSNSTQGEAANATTRPACKFKVGKQSRLGIPGTWITGYDNPMTKSLTFVEWEDVSTGMAVYTHVIMAILIPVLTMDLSNPAVANAARKANLLEDRLTLRDANEIMMELGKLDFWADTFQSFEEVMDAFTATRESMEGIAAMKFRANILEKGESFNVEAQAGRGREGTPTYRPPVAAVEGPEKLKLFYLASWDRFYSKAALPLRALGLAIIMLGDCSLRAVRLDETSDVSVAGELLSELVAAYARVKTPSAALLACKLPEFLGSPSILLPNLFLGNVFTPSAVLAECLDGWTLWTGSAERRSEIEMRLLPNACKNPLVNLAKLSACFDSPMSFVASVRRACAFFVPKMRDLPLHMQLTDLEKALASREAHIDQLLENDPPLSGTALVQMLFIEQEVSAGGPAGAADQSADGPTLAPMRELAYQDAINHTSFRGAVETGAGKAGIPLLELCFLSGSLLLTAILVFGSKNLASRHPFTAKLMLELPARQAYFAYVLAVDLASHAVPEALRSFEWCPTLLKHLLSGAWHKMDTVNAPGGFLGLRELSAATNYAKVPASMFFVLETALTGQRDYWIRLLTALNYPRVVASGFTVDSVFDYQIEYMREADALPLEESRQWKLYGAEQFAAMLERAGNRFITILSNPRLSEQELGCFVAADDLWYVNLSAKRAQALSLVSLRRAFPTLLKSAPVVLAGAATGGVVNPNPKPPKDNPPGKRQKVKDTRSGVRKNSDSPAQGPGSKAYLAKMLSDDTLFLARYTFNIKEVAKHCKVKVEDYCWPVLLSTKEGDAALELCPCAQTHSADMHTPPNGFNKNAIIKKFGKKATNKQCRQAGWVSKF